MKNQLTTPNILIFVRANQQANLAYEMIKNNPFAHAVLKGVNSMVALLNMENEFVFASDLFLKNYNFKDVEAVVGHRIGETLKCIYYDPKNDCGTQNICASCGVSAILTTENSAIENVSATIIAKSGDVIIEKNYELSYVGVEFSGNKFKMLTINDASAVKRKERLESVYLKRMDSQLAIVKEQSGLLKIRAKKDGSSQIDLYELLDDTIIQLKQRTSFQKTFSEALNETLVVVNEKINSFDLFTNLIEDFLGRCANKEVVIKKGLEFYDFNFYSDKNILYCALVSLIENALVASVVNSNIVISMSCNEDSVVFAVHNDAVIPEYIQNKIFRNKKGIGTYGVKLFVESYLKGSVYFTSVEGLGTTFYLKLPMLIIF